MAATSSTLPEYPSDAVEGMAAVSALADRFGAYARSTRIAIDEAEKFGDADTNDLFTEVSQRIDGLISGSWRRTCRPADVSRPQVEDQPASSRMNAQNSFPSGSAMTVHELPPGCGSMIVAPTSDQALESSDIIDVHVEMDPHFADLRLGNLVEPERRESGGRRVDAHARVRLGCEALRGQPFEIVGVVGRPAQPRPSGPKPPEGPRRGAPPPTNPGKPGGPPFGGGVPFGGLLPKPPPPSPGR